jgi:transposase
MAKYDENFKFKVVKSYLSGQGGSKAVGQAYGVSYGQVRRWVSRYRQHGMAGLRKKFSHYSAQFKLTVLRRMWRSHQSCSQVAAHFDLRVSTSVIRDWERRYHEGGLDALASKPKGRSSKMAMPPAPKPAAPVADDKRTREELLTELEYLRAENAYLKKLDALIQAKKLAAQKRRG